MPHSIKTGINAAKSTNQPFQLLWKGAEIQLLVGQIKADEIEEARSALDEKKKGLTEIKGKCSFDPQAKKIVFFSSSAPSAPTFPTKLKAYIGKFASITLDAKDIILTKKKTDLLYADPDDNKTVAPGTPTPEQPGPTPTAKKLDENGVPEAPTGDLDQQQTFTNRLQQLSPLYVKAIQAMPESRGDLDQLSKKATESSKGGNYKEALALLDAWEEAIKKTLQSAVKKKTETTSPTPKDEVSTPSPESKDIKPEPTDEKSIAIKRLNALNAKLQLALKANVEESDQLRELSIHVRNLLSKGEPGILFTLDKLEKLLAGIPESKLAPTPKPTAKEEPKKEEPKSEGPKEEKAKEKSPLEMKADVIKRLNGLNASLQAALKEKGPKADEVKKLSLDARKLLTNSEFGQASELLTKLEETLAAMAAEEGSKVPAPPKAEKSEASTEVEEDEDEEEVPEPKEVSNVVFTKSRLQWDSARKSVAAELKTLEKSIIETCQQINENEESEDEVDIDELKGQVKLLYGIMENLDESLMDKLDEALNAKTPDLRKARQKEASGIIKKYLQFVNSDPVMARIDSSGFVETKIRKTVTDVLKDLQSKL